MGGGGIPSEQVLGTEGDQNEGLENNVWVMREDSFGMELEFEKGEVWRALTNIKLRTEPSITAAQFEGRVTEGGEVGFIKAGEKFVVAVQRRAKVPTGRRHRMYLRIACTKAWAFDLGVAGDWEGKYIAERVLDEDGKPVLDTLRCSTR